MSDWKANWYKEQYEREAKDAYFFADMLQGFIVSSEKLMEHNDELRKENAELRKRIRELQEKGE